MHAHVLPNPSGGTDYNVPASSLIGRKKHKKIYASTKKCLLEASTEISVLTQVFKYFSLLISFSVLLKILKFQFYCLSVLLKILIAWY
jgi:hypothetical protein